MLNETIAHQVDKKSHGRLLKAIERGSGVIFSCQAQVKVLIAGMPKLFTECQNLTLFKRYERSNFWASILSHSKYWTIWAPKIVYLGL